MSWEGISQRVIILYLVDNMLSYSLMYAHVPNNGIPVMTSDIIFWPCNLLGLSFDIEKSLKFCIIERSIISMNFIRLLMGGFSKSKLGNEFLICRNVGWFLHYTCVGVTHVWGLCCGLLERASQEVVFIFLGLSVFTVFTHQWASHCLWYYLVLTSS